MAVFVKFGLDFISYINRVNNDKTKDFKILDKNFILYFDYLSVHIYVTWNCNFITRVYSL